MRLRSLKRAHLSVMGLGSVLIWNSRIGQVYEDEEVHSSTSWV